MAQTLDADLLLATVERLERRIRERFPDAHLGDVAAALRFVTWMLALGIVGLIGSIPFLFIGELGSVRTVLAFVQVLEPTLGSLFFVGTILAYLVSVENRVKRGRALNAVHELRAMVPEGLAEDHDPRDAPAGLAPRGRMSLEWIVRLTEPP